jgi:hypothetical protein
MMVSYRFIGIGPHTVDSLPTKVLRPSVFGVDYLQAVNAGGDAKENGRGNSARVPQLASIPKTKRQAARQPTDNGTDEASNERKPRQRPASRCWNSAYVRVHRVRILTLEASFKRLIPYSKQNESIWGKTRRDCAMAKTTLYVELKDIINAAGGDWILEAEHEGDDNEQFLVACFALMLKEPSPRVVKFLRGVADSLERTQGNL